MTIEKRIELRNNTYYIRIEVEYKRENDIIILCFKDFADDYYDGGDFSNLLIRVKENYTYELAKNYGTNIGFLDDALYLYDHIPFLSGIRDVYQKEDDNMPYSTGYISSSELDEIITMNNIKMQDKTNFRLYDERTWNL